mgnify:CR=1 FL=1
MDIVIPLALNGLYEELRYTLRSIAANARDLGRIFIVTERLPSWIQNVEHAHAKDIYPANKDANLIRKVLIACQREDLTDRFLFWSDDQVLLHPMQLPAIPITYGDKKVDEKSTLTWRNRLYNTGTLLKRLGMPIVFYDTHCPQPYNKTEFIDIFSKLNYVDAPGYCINTAFFNQLDLQQETLIHMHDVKMTFETKTNSHEVANQIASESLKYFLGHNDLGWKNGVRQYLERTYSCKCQFEK